jgi:hypothetical protein
MSVGTWLAAGWVGSAGGDALTPSPGAAALQISSGIKSFMSQLAVFVS